MKILLKHSHQTRVHNFARLNHDFYIPTNEAKWTSTALEDYKYCYPDEDIPENLHFDETIEDPDITLGIGGDIQILHDLHTPYREDCVNIYQTESQLYHNPPENDKWFLIKHGVDTERFSGWGGGEEVFTLFNNLYGRGTTKTQTKRYADDLKEYGGNIYGYNCEDGYIPHQEVHKSLQNCKAYVHLRSRGFAPFNVAEALCVGCPVIAVPNPTLEDDIIAGYNAIVTKNITKALENLTEERAKELSQNARSLGKKRFSLEENLARWDYIFRKTRMLKNTRGSGNAQ